MDATTRKWTVFVLSIVAAVVVYAGVIVLMIRGGMQPGVAIASMLAVGSGSGYAFYLARPKARTGSRTGNPVRDDGGRP